MFIMTKMEENILKKTEFKGMVATVVSTVTILIGIFVGGYKMKDAIVDDIRKEFKAEIRNQVQEFEARQAIRDKDQDFRIQFLENYHRNFK